MLNIKPKISNHFESYADLVLYYALHRESHWNEGIEGIDLFLPLKNVHPRVLIVN